MISQNQMSTLVKLFQLCMCSCNFFQKTLKRNACYLLWLPNWQGRESAEATCNYGQPMHSQILIMYKSIWNCRVLRPESRSLFILHRWHAARYLPLRNWTRGNPCDRRSGLGNLYCLKTWVRFLFPVAKPKLIYYWAYQKYIYSNLTHESLFLLFH